MPSKYDQYWADHLDQLRQGVVAANSAGIAKVALQGLTHLGNRASWQGTAEVRGSQVTASSMAHATALAKMVATSGLCTQWPEQTIRFSINTTGDVLTIRTGTSPPSDPRAASGDLSWTYRRDARVADSASSHSADTDEFYAIFAELAQKVGGPRLLRECTARSGWPSHGVYFFFENGELRPDGSRRVVRVGTHAVTLTSQATLWGRLRQHRGHADGSGNHRASVFRHHVGAALIKREALPQALLDSWLSRRNRDPALAVDEAVIEGKVSSYIGAMPFLWLSVPERADRDYIERQSIALLSGHRGGFDTPSTGWLGRDAERVEIRESGLWNVDYVDLSYDPGILQRFAQLASGPRQP